MTPSDPPDNPADPTARPDGTEVPVRIVPLSSREPAGGAVEISRTSLDATLADLCRLAPAESAVLLERGPEGALRVVATWPATTADLSAALRSVRDWLDSCHEPALHAIETNAPACLPFHTPEDLYGQPPLFHDALLPLAGCGRPAQCAAFLLASLTPGALAAATERLGIALPLIDLEDVRATLSERARAAGRLAFAIETLAAVQRHPHFLPAAMALCNEVATRWRCERTALGLLRDRYVELRAISHTESFSPKAKLARAFEAAMEECLDQDTEILVPAPASATWCDRAHRDLAAGQGPAAVASFPLRLDGEPAGAFLAERTPDRPFEDEEVLALRLTLELCTPVLLRLVESDRWFGTRAVRRLGEALVGPKRTGTKLLVLLGAVILFILVFVHGTHRVEAPFVLKAETDRVIPAPFDGFLDAAPAQPGDTVVSGTTVLARLSVVELRLQLAAAKAEQASYLKEASARLRDRGSAEEQIARAQADKIAARADQLEHLLRQAEIISPIDGTVVAGDYREKVGAPVRQGDVLYEVAALETLYAQAFVPDEEIGFLAVGQHGDLAAAALPSDRVEVIVDRIEPIAVVVDRRNVFRVRLRLESRPSWMRPGMEGVSRLRIGERTWGWLVFHRFVDWLRMTLWL